MSSSDTPTDLYAIDPTAQNLLFREARTARAFSSEPVSDDTIAAVYDLVKYAPTFMNAQPLRIVVARSDDARERLIGHLIEGNKPKTASAPLAVVLAADTGFHDTLPAQFPVFPGARDMFLDDQQRTDKAIEQAWLQAGYFIIGVRALGLAAGPMAGFDNAGVDADLLAGTNLRSILVVNIGHPAEGATHGRLPRLDVDEAVITL